MRIYTIPGLGFDRRIFEHIDLPLDRTTHLHWIEPEPKESISNYAKRMAKMIEGEEVRIIGHSFGGIMAQEIAQHRSISKVILVSSIRSAAENPFQFRVMRHIPLHHLFTRGLVQRTIGLWGSTHGYKTKAERELVRQMVSTQSNAYLKWALHELAHWKGGMADATELVHIHGDKDKTFPHHLLEQVDHTIKGGDHNMLRNRARELSQVLNLEI